MGPGGRARNPTPDRPVEDLTDIIAGAETLEGFDLDAIELAAERAPTDSKAKKAPPAGQETGVGLRTRITTRATRRRMYDLRDIPNAVKFIRPLPADGETVHAIMGGDFAAWDLVPATMQIVGAPMVALHMATLGFNAQNSSHLAQLMADRQIGSAVVLCSDYFAKSDAATFAEAKDRLAAVGAKLVSTRNHAKVLVLNFGVFGYVVESSANLRSCKNLEQVAVTRDRALVEFHRGWITKAAGLKC